MHLKRPRRHWNRHKKPNSQAKGNDGEKKSIAYGSGRFVKYDFVNLGTDIGIIGEDMGRTWRKRTRSTKQI